jgi:ribosome biogenesis GTPase
MPTDTASSRSGNHDHHGIVITNFGNEVLIETNDGTRERAIAKQSLASLVTGDRISWQRNEQGYASIYELHERHGVLARETKDKQQKIIAVNVDVVLIVCTHKPQFKTGLIDRYLAACELAGITAWIIFNKTDTMPNELHEQVTRTFALYEKIGYPVYYTSAKTNTGFDPVRTALNGKTAVLVGQSGVGKSTIIKALIPSASPRIAAISESSNKGRHTTTHTEIYHLNENTSLIDSPGIREFGLKSTDREILAEGFRDFRPFIDACRFRDCQHTGEPACAIEAAVKQGKIDPLRLESYRNILDSL